MTDWGTQLSPDEERLFQQWYGQASKELSLNPNPDDPQHAYDYRAAYRAGRAPEAFTMGATRERVPTTSELVFFQRTGVPGYAAEDRRVVMNPRSPLSPREQSSVRLNEAVRNYLAMKQITPDFALTPYQQVYLTRMGYPVSGQKATIAARIMARDPSAGTATPEQRAFVGQQIEPAFHWSSQFKAPWHPNRWVTIAPGMVVDTITGEIHQPTSRTAPTYGPTGP